MSENNELGKQHVILVFKGFSVQCLGVFIIDLNPIKAI